MLMTDSQSAKELFVVVCLYKKYMNTLLPKNSNHSIVLK